VPQVHHVVGHDQLNRIPEELLGERAAKMPKPCGGMAAADGGEAGGNGMLDGGANPSTCVPESRLSLPKACSIGEKSGE